MIGIFDSGVGGMTVARAIEHILPDFPLLYLGDLARSPYGTKSGATITEYSLENTQFLLDKGATCIVIACNSASSVALDQLRQKYSVPVIGVISPAVKEAALQTKTGRIGVIGTRATIRSKIYETKLSAELEDCKVYSQACPLLVPLVEEDWISKKETKMIIRRYLYTIKNKQVDTLVLGCTHYPLLKHLIQPRIGKKVKLIDSSEATAKYLKEYFKTAPVKPSLGHSVDKNCYYLTDVTEAAQTIANKIFGRKIKLLTT
jgi:glutamate racemase